VEVFIMQAARGALFKRKANNILRPQKMIHTFKNRFYLINQEKCTGIYFLMA